MNNKKEPMTNAMDYLNTCHNNNQQQIQNQAQKPKQLFLFNVNDLLLSNTKDNKDVKKA